jgi:hypothetical protein
MAEEKPISQDQPLHVWLPKTLLTFLVFAALVFVIYGTMFGMGARQLSSGNTWALIVALVMLLLLPVADRVEEISLSPTSLTARLNKAQALKEVGSLENKEAVEAAQAQILRARSADQVQAAKAWALELNVTHVVDQVKEAIGQKRKVYVRYRPDSEQPVETYLAAPLDIKPGKTPATRIGDYLWVYSYEHESVISLRLGQVMGVELSKETFDPAEIMADWKNKQPAWNVEREW